MSDVFTNLAAMVIPSRFMAYFIQRKQELSALYQSGIIVHDPEMDALAMKGGKLIDMPFFNDLTGDAQVLNDEGDLNVAAITTGQDQARLQALGKAFGATDLSAALSGADPMKAIADLLAGWWNRVEQGILISTLEGIFAANVIDNASDHVLDVSEVVGNGGCLTKENLAAAAQLLGDAKGKLSAYAMHSACETVLNTQYGGSTFNKSDDPAVLATMGGRKIIMDDEIAYNPSTKVATIYLFAQGAVASGEGRAPVPFETGRNPLTNSGQSYLVSRRHFILHPRGIKWNESSVTGGKFPNNTDLENADNWTRVYESKAIRIVKLIVRAEAAVVEPVTVQTTPSLPEMTSASTKAGQVGVALTHQITADNAAVASYTMYDECEGLSINAQTGEITGTPVADSEGEYVTTIGITTSVGTTLATVTFTIAAAA
jgi:hypothetical protein